jgi:hypothetical protein
MRDRVAALCTIGNLAVGKNPAQEAVAVAFEQLGDAMQVRGVYSNANDVHARASA